MHRKRDLIVTYVVVAFGGGEVAAGTVLGNAPAAAAGAAMAVAFAAYGIFRFG